MDLRALLESCEGLDDEQVEAKARQLYGELYLNHGHFGLHQTHDGKLLLFHGRQFDHAFRTTSDRYVHPERKDKVARDRVERIRWIGEVVSGRVRGSACFETPGPTGRSRPANRLYVVFAEGYVVWLEPREDGAWKFASAYVAGQENIQRYQRGGRTIKRWDWTKNAP